MLLAINTSTTQFSVALMENNATILSEYTASKGARHFGGLMPAIDFMIKGTATSAGDISAIAVANGPGSFTGLRVGISFAKGLAHGLDIPLIGVSTLEALANQLPYCGLCLAPLLDSRKDEVFTARFVMESETRVRRLGEDITVKFTYLPEIFEGHTLFIGNNFALQAGILKGIFDSKAHLAPPDLWNLKASSVGALGLKALKDRGPDDPHDLKPIYLRPPDIRPNPYYTPGS